MITPYRPAFTQVLTHNTHKIQMYLPPLTSTQEEALSLDMRIRLESGIRISNLKYLKYQKYVKIKTKEAEQLCFNDLCNDLPMKPRKFWNFVRSKKCESLGVGTLRAGNRIYTEDREKAYLLNDQFKSVFKPNM